MENIQQKGLKGKDERARIGEMSKEEERDVGCSRRGAERKEKDTLKENEGRTVV